MDRWVADVELEGKSHKIFMKRRYSPAVGEHLFEIEIIHEDDSDTLTNQISIYSKKDAETWIRMKLNCKGKRFVWTEVR